MPFAPPAPDTAEAPAFTPPPLASAETEGGFTPPTLESVEGLDLSVPFAGESAAELRRRDQTQVANNHDLRDVLGNTWGVVNTPIIDVHPGGGMVLGHEFKDEETLKYIQEMMQHGSVEEAIGLGLRAGGEEFLAGLATPLSLGTLTVAGLLNQAPKAARLLSAVFAYQTGKSLATDTAKALGEEYAKPPEKRDVARLTQLWVGAGLNAPLAGTLASHSILGDRAPLVTSRRPGEKPAEAAPVESGRSAEEAFVPPPVESAEAPSVPTPADVERAAAQQARIEEQAGILPAREEAPVPPSAPPEEIIAATQAEAQRQHEEHLAEGERLRQQNQAELNKPLGDLSTPIGAPVTEQPAPPAAAPTPKGGENHAPQTQRQEGVLATSEPPYIPPGVNPPGGLTTAGAVLPGAPENTGAASPAASVETPAAPAPTVKESLPVDLRPAVAAIADAIRKGPITKKDVTGILEKVYGGTQAQGKFDAKDLGDAVEMAVNQLVGDGSIRPTGNAVQAMNDVDLLRTWLDRLPTQTTRTAEMDRLQQFSTPPHLAYVANWAANLKPGDVVLEPSAGTGGLAAFAKAAGARVIANELSPRRVELLKQTGIPSVIYQENAEHINAILRTEIEAGNVPEPTAVVMNPPFSNAAKSGEKNTMIGAKHVEEALKLLPQGGRLVAIVGEGMGSERPRFKEWWKRIGDEYTVRANIGVSGKEYTKYGTSFGNQLVVIDKTGPTTEPVVTGRVEKVEELVPLLERIRHERPTIERAGETEPASAKPTGAATTAAGGGSGSPGPAAPAEPGLEGIAAGRRGSEPQSPGAEGAGRLEPGSDAASPSPEASGIGSVGERPGPRQPGERGGGHLADVGDAEPLLDHANPAPAPHVTEADKNVGLTTEQAIKGQKALNEHGVFSEYKPVKLRVKGAKDHPTPLVEPTAMAAVDPVDPTYSPKLPKDRMAAGFPSLAQLEQIVYAGQAHQKMLSDGVTRQGYFIGDGTGVGKGVTIAGIILDNWNQGRRKAVWMSAKTDLFNDAKRDFNDLGFDVSKVINMRPNGGRAIVGAKEGVAFVPYSSLKIGNPGLDPKTLESGKPRLYPPAKAQTRGSKQDVKPSRLHLLQDWLGPDFDGVIVFDEAHKAGNAMDLKGSRGMAKASATAKAVLDAQALFPKARVVYASATGATQVRNLAYADRLGIWGAGTPFESKAKFIDTIQSGGLSAMEIVARDLKAMGRYLARTLSFEGVGNRRLTHELTSEQKVLYNDLGQGWQTVMSDVQDTMARTGASRNGDALQRANGALWGAQQRFYNQLLTALQLPTIIRDMKAERAKGHSCVLQLVNTNESTLGRELAEKGAEKFEGDEHNYLEDLDLSPKKILLQYIENSYPTQKYEKVVDANGNEKWEPVRTKDGKPVIDPEAVAAKRRLMDKIALLQAPENPLEQIFNTFGVEDVAEITGRSQRTVMKKQDDGTVKLVLERNRGESQRKVEAKEFQDGKRHILIFSDAGGTGFSFHASRRALNQSRRIHYLVQAGWRADNAMQGFGRTHRSDQANAPEYVLPSTDLSGHQRFISTIARRLSELGALTGGERKAAGGEMFDERSNLEDSYAEDAVEKFFVDLYQNKVPGMKFADLTEKLGYVRKLFDEQSGTFKKIYTLLDAKTGGLNRSKIPTIQQFLNRILSLEYDAQNAVFNEFDQRRTTRIDAAKADGSYDPGTQILKGLSIRKLGEETVWQSPDTTAATKLVQVEHTQPVKVMPFESYKPRNTKEGYVVNQRSGRVYFLREGYPATDERSGAVIPRYARHGATGYDLIPQDEVRDPQRYRIVPPDEAKALWDAEYAKAAKTKTYQDTYLVGSMLPIWDRIQLQSPKIWRITTDGGETFLGAHVPGDAVPDLRARLGAGRGAAAGPEAVFRDILERGRPVTLANGWTLQRVRVQGEPRIEVKGLDFAQMKTGLFGDEMGNPGEYGFTERIQWQPRFFVPTEEAAGIEAMRKILDKAPEVTGEETHEMRTGGIDKPAGKDNGVTDESSSNSSTPMAAPANAGRAADAAAHLERSGATVESLRGASGEIERQARQLKDWAAARGAILPAGDLGQSKGQGAEHEVFYDSGQNRAVKRTYPGTFGVTPDPKGAQQAATPLFYLRRLALMNEVFGSDQRLEGVQMGRSPIIGAQGEQPALVISQPWIRAADANQPHPSPAEIAGFMTRLGFTPKPKSYFGWERAADGVTVLDARPDNFIKSKDGVVPIDLVVARKGEAAGTLKPETHEMRTGGAQKPTGKRLNNDQANPVVSTPTVGRTEDSPANALVKELDRFRAVTAPQTRGEQARYSANLLRELNARMANELTRADEALRPFRRDFDRTPVPKDWQYDPTLPLPRNLAFIDAYEGGDVSNLAPKEQTAAVEFKRQNAEWVDRVHALGTGALQHCIENYFPHLWENPQRAGTVLGQLLAKRPLEGPKGFLKQRTHELFREALAAGLKPVHDNPVDLWMLKRREVERYIMARTFINEMKAAGLMKFNYVFSRTPDGWSAPKDRAFDQWAPPSVPIKEAFDAGMRAKTLEVLERLGVPHQRLARFRGGAWGKETHQVRFETGGTASGAEGAGQVAGIPGTERITTKFGGPEFVIWHETGHVLDNRYPDLRQTLNASDVLRYQLGLLSAERARTYPGQMTQAPSAKYLQAPSEQIATVLQAWLHAPEVLERVAPTVKTAFEGFLRAHPELSILDEIKPTLSLGEATTELRLAGPVKLGQWVLPDAATRVVDNFLSPGLNNQLWYRSLRESSNFLNGVQLGLSAFHLGFTSLDAATSRLAVAIEDAFHGRPLSALGAAASVPLSPITNLRSGARLRAEVLKPGSTDAGTAALAKALEQAGGRIGQDRFWATQFTRRMVRALHEGTASGYLRGTVQAPFALFEQTLRPIMEYIVPRQKLGVFADLAQRELVRLGPDADAGATREALRKVWDSVDNRMGQVVYDNLFYNRAVKDLALLSFRAYGWQLGKYREGIGAAIDTARAAGKIATGKAGEAEFTHRMAYAMALPILVGTIGGITHYLLTGQQPQGLDWMMPQTGETDRNGNPVRLNFPSYVKDVIAYSKHPLTSLGHSVNPLLSSMIDLVANRDFYDVQIHDPHDPLTQQAGDVAQFAAKQLIPFSVSGTLKLREDAAPLQRQVLPFFGITPAPSRMSMTPAQEFAAETMASNMPRHPKTKEQWDRAKLMKEIVTDLKQGNREAASDAFRRGLDTATLDEKSASMLIERALVTPLEFQAGHFTPEAAMQTWRLGNEAERAALLPIVRLKVLFGKIPGEDADAKRDAWGVELGAQPGWWMKRGK